MLGTYLGMWRFLVIELCVKYTVQQINWCDTQYECASEKHTMCIYKEDADNEGCSGMVDAMVEEDRQRLLGMHNYVRNYIAVGNLPGWSEASNMRQLTWDHTSELVARRWAFQCQNTHDKCRKTPPDFNNIGQNFGIATGDKNSLGGVFQIFKGWLDQILLTSGSNVEPFKYDRKYDHFAAIVWAETYKIGCGLVNSTFTGSSSKQYRQMLVCNYAPAGNVDGKPMWTKGDPCTNCPESTSCNANSTYSYLCAFPSDSSVEQPIPIDIPSSEPCTFNHKSTNLLVSLLVIFKTSEVKRRIVIEFNDKRV